MADHGPCQAAHDWQHVGSKLAVGALPHGVIVRVEVAPQAYQEISLPVPEAERFREAIKEAINHPCGPVWGGRTENQD